MADYSEFDGNKRNQIEERINGILKIEFKLHQVFKSRTDALLAVKLSINPYNNLRLDMSFDYMTPAEVHALIKRWKNERKRMIESND